MTLQLNRSDQEFTCCGTRISAWLYCPCEISKPPVVVMAHGFAAERTFRLPDIAERFAAAGFAVLLFDYRHFGGSDGTPRHLVKPSLQLADWRAAIEHARSLGEVDGSRLALWGTSLSGGHVIAVAAWDPGVSAVVAQVPFVEWTSSAASQGIWNTFRSMTAALRDYWRYMIDREPLRISVYGPKRALACLANDEANDGYPRLIPPESAWKNECPARSLISLASYCPRTVAKHVRCPALVILGERDSLVSPASVRLTAASMPNATLHALDAGHFDVYEGATFDRVTDLTIGFLSECFAATASDSQKSV